MKKQILNQKTYVLIFTVLLVYGIHGIGYAELEFAEGNSTTREIAENTPKCNNIGAPLRYSAEEAENCIDIWLYGPDAKSFAITLPFRGGVQLRTKSALNYEKKNFYEVTLSITDMEEPEDTDIITVIIRVTNVNETPVFSEEMDEAAVNRVHRSIPENTPVGISIGKPVSAIDPDGSDVVLTYSLSGNDANMFEIDGGTGQLHIKAPLDYEAFERDPRTYFVDVEVSDGSASAKTEVWIHVEPVNEFAPIFIEGDTTTREINETTEAGVNVGNPITAMDMDAGETLEYSIVDSCGDMFEIDSRTGQLKTKMPIDYSTKPVHILEILVSDGNQTDGIIVIVYVLSDILEIPDRSLARMIRLTLGLASGDDISKRSMSELTTLVVDGNSNTVDLINFLKIQDLTGLENATNLTTLELTTNIIRDLTPIGELTNLTTLDLYGNQIVSFMPLKGLLKLNKLNLSYNRTNDITSLARLTNLTELSLQANSIIDITPLKGLTSLRTLDIGFNSIENITPLKDLTDLTELILHINDIRDITPLKDLTNLRKLDMGFNLRIKDITPLNGLTNLTELILNYNDIRDITPLEGLTKLRTLDLSNNSRLTDISSLAGLVNLETLKLAGCPITDFSPLEDLSAEIDVLE
ncbi:MAG: leucine-rich repeat domain-containing protein [Candidatus Poribacteria bacterium]|nr:leucine-rich repeat domain-containing protein [Candidatus Poribacteria bacterium]